MNFFLREFLMPDDSLSPAEKAVVAFFEIIAFALGWAGVDRLLAGNSLLIVLPIFLACIVISYAGFKWPHVKSKISGRIASAIEDLAGSFRFRVSVILVLSLIAVSYLLVFMHSLRSDLDD